MRSVGSFLGIKRNSPNIVHKHLLPDLLEQAKNDSTHEHKRAMQTLRDAYDRCTIQKTNQGDWRIIILLQGRCTGDTPTTWNIATNGGAWVHAGAGYWKSKEDAESALREAMREVYREELERERRIQEDEIETAKLREIYVPQFRELERALRETGYSYGGYEERISEVVFLGKKLPISAEGIAQAREIFAKYCEELNEQAECKKIAEEIVAKLVKRGLEYRLESDGVYTVEYTPSGLGFPKRAYTFTRADLEKLREKLAEVEKPLDLKGLKNRFPGGKIR